MTYTFKVDWLYYPDYPKKNIVRSGTSRVVANSNANAKQIFRKGNCIGEYTLPRAGEYLMARKLINS